MPWWWSRRETGTPYAAADAVYDESIRLSRDGDTEAALAKAQVAAATYRLLVAKARSIDSERRLAKALWREAMLYAVLRRFDDARVSARECMELGRELLARLDAKHAAMDGVVLEAATALNDFNQLGIFDASDEETDLIERAIAIARSGSGIGSQQALATSLHNRVANYCAAWRAARPSATEIEHAIALMQEAIQLREGLCRGVQTAPHTYWELANSRTQLGKLLIAWGSAQDAIAELTSARQVIASVSGPTVDALRIDIEASLVTARRSMRSASDSVEPEGLAEPERADPGAEESPVEHFNRLVRSNVEAADLFAEQHAEAMIESHHLSEVLKMIEAIRRAGDDVARPPARSALWAERHLRVLLSMGQHRRVLELLARALQDADDAMTVATDASSSILREKILFHGVGAAKGVGEWARAHQLSKRICESLEDRSADRAERLWYRWSDYAALFELGRVDEADALLRECLEEANSLGDHLIRGLVFGGLGLIASRRCDSVQALALKRSALNALYMSSGLQDAKAAAHDAYGNELARTQLLAEAGAHWSLAAIIRIAMRKNSTDLVKKLSLLEHYCEPVPSSLEELLATIERTANVRATLLLEEAKVTPEVLEFLRIQLPSATSQR